MVEYWGFHCVRQEYLHYLIDHYLRLSVVTGKLVFVLVALTCNPEIKFRMCIEATEEVYH